MQISKELIKTLRQNNTQLTHLNLSNGAYVRIANLESLSELRVLDLSRNKITKIEGLQLPNLEYLDISHNAITRVENLSSEALPSLKTLKIRGNRLNNLQEALRTQFTQLTNLEELEIDLGEGSVQELALFNSIHSLKKLNGKAKSFYTQNTQNASSKINNYTASNEVLLQSQIDSYREIVEILERQVGAGDAAAQWRAKCFDFLVKEKILRENAQNSQLELRRDIEVWRAQAEESQQRVNSLQEEIQAVKMLNQQLQRDLEQRGKLVEQMQLTQEGQRLRQQQQLKLAQERFALQMQQAIEQTQSTVENKLEWLQGRISASEFALKRMRQRLIVEKESSRNFQNDVCHSLKTIVAIFASHVQSSGGSLLATAVSKVQSAVVNEEKFLQEGSSDGQSSSRTVYFLLQKLRELLTRLLEENERAQRQSREEVRSLEKIIERVRAEQSEVYQDKAQESRNLEQALASKKQKIEELESELRRREENDQRLRDENAKIERNLQQLTTNLGRMKDTYEKDITQLREEQQRQLHELTHNYEVRVVRAEQEKEELSQILRAKELDYTHVMDDLGSKINNIQNEKNSELENIQQLYLEEREQRKKFQAKCSDFVRVIEIKDKQLRELSKHSGKSPLQQRNDWSPILKQLADEAHQTRKALSPRGTAAGHRQKSGERSGKVNKFYGVQRGNVAMPTEFILDLSSSQNAQQNTLNGRSLLTLHTENQEQRATLKKVEDVEKMALSVLQNSDDDQDM